MYCSSLSQGNKLRKKSRIPLFGHYLFLEAHRFGQATLSENCLLLGADNVANKVLSIVSIQMEDIVYNLGGEMHCASEVPGTQHNVPG